MGRSKKGFSKGSVVVCIKNDWQNGQRFITIGKEYIVLSYYRSHFRSPRGYPRILIKEDTVGGTRIVPCSYFMSKDEHLRLQRENKINEIINNKNEI